PPMPVEATGGTSTGPTDDADDAALIEKAKAAKNGEKFKKLWSGDWSGYPSQSEAELALAGLLAFWCAGDAARIDKLFRASGLMPPKWDERRGSTTYGGGTVATAVGGKTEFYVPHAAAADEPGGDKEKRESAATRLVNYARAALELFHTPDQGAFGTTYDV